MVTLKLIAKFYNLRLNFLGIKLYLQCLVINRIKSCKVQCHMLVCLYESWKRKNPELLKSFLKIQLRKYIFFIVFIAGIKPLEKCFGRQTNDIFYIYFNQVDYKPIENILQMYNLLIHLLLLIFYVIYLFLLLLLFFSSPTFRFLLNEKQKHYFYYHSLAET